MSCPAERPAGPGPPEDAECGNGSPISTATSSGQAGSALVELSLLQARAPPPEPPAPGFAHLRRPFSAGSAATPWDDDRSSDSSDSECGDAAAAGGGGAGAWGAAAGGLLPFEVEEPEATEVKFLKGALAKKSQECEHLRQIIRELSQSRAKAQRTKVELEEQLSGLQKEHYRVLKVAELARTVSQQSVARASGLRSELAATQDQLRRARRRAAAADKAAKDLREDNAELRQRLLLLQDEAFAADGCRTSACAREFLLSAAVGLY